MPFIAEEIKLPPLPTRSEIADALNEAMPERRHKFSERTVRGWQERGLIKPHPGFRWPVRFDARHVAEFLNGMFRSRY